MFKVSASFVHIWLQPLTKVLDSPCHRLQTTLEMIWNDLPQKPAARAEQNFCKQLQACMDKAGGPFEH